MLTQCRKFALTRRPCALQGGEVPVTEMFGTFALSIGAAVRVHPPAPSESSSSS